MRKMKKILLVVVVGVTIIGLSMSAEATQKEFKLGVAVALSGPVASVGIGFRNGAQVVADYFNSRTGLNIDGEKYVIKLVEADTKFTADGATTAARRLVDAERVNMILGAIATPQTLGVQSVTEPAKIITLHTAAAPETLKDKRYSFRSYISYYELYPGIFKWLKKNRPNAKRLAMLDLDYESSYYGHKLVNKLAKRFGIEVVYDDYFEGGTKDFNPFLLKALSKRPDMFFNTASPGTSWGLIMKQARNLGFRGFFFESHPPAVAEDIEIAGKEAVQGLIGFGYPTSGQSAPEGLKRFRAIYTKKYSAWSNDSLVPALPLCAVFLAIEETGSLNSDKIVAALESGKKWKTPFGVTGIFAGAKTYGYPHQWFAPEYVLEVRGERAVPIGIIPIEDMVHGWE